MGLAIDHMIVPSGSAGTHAGILAGMEGNRAGIPVSGINVSRSKQEQEALVHDLAVRTAEWVGAGNCVPENAVRCFDACVGPGYSLPTDGMVDAVRLLASTEAILLDPVYSGKSMVGCIDLTRKGFFEGCKNVLFLHTGGSPSLYAYLESFINPLYGQKRQGVHA